MGLHHIGQHIFSTISVFQNTTVQQSMEKRKSYSHHLQSGMRHSHSKNPQEKRDSVVHRALEKDAKKKGFQRSWNAFKQLLQRKI